MSAVADARALLRQFLQSDYRVLHAVVAGHEIFISRDAAVRAPDLLYGDAGIPDLASVDRIEAAAPHVGTLIDLAPIGALIAQGGVYGRLRVLDQETDLVSARSGRVHARLRAPGELVEYGDALVVLEPV